MLMMDMIGHPWRIDIDELSARAARLWTYSDQLYETAKLPFVSVRVLKTAPTFGAILQHICEAAQADAEARYAEQFSELDRETVRLKVEIRSLVSKYTGQGADWLRSGHNSYRIEGSIEEPRVLLRQGEPCRRRVARALLEERHPTYDRASADRLGACPTNGPDQRPGGSL
jgi:hypothetical protein